MLQQNSNTVTVHRYNCCLFSSF